MPLIHAHPLLVFALKIVPYPSIYYCLFKWLVTSLFTSVYSWLLNLTQAGVDSSAFANCEGGGHWQGSPVNLIAVNMYIVDRGSPVNESEL